MFLPTSHPIHHQILSAPSPRSLPIPSPHFNGAHALDYLTALKATFSGPRSIFLPVRHSDLFENIHHMIKLLEAHPPKHPSPLAQNLDSSSGLGCSGSLLATSPCDFPALSLTINSSAAMRQGHFIPRACVGWLGLPLMKCHSLHDFTAGIYFLKQSWWLKGACRDDFW